MVRYVREPGEVELLKEIVEGIRDKQRVPGFPILTDRGLSMAAGAVARALTVCVHLILIAFIPVPAIAAVARARHGIARGAHSATLRSSRFARIMHISGNGHFRST